MKKAARGDYEIDADAEAELLGTDAPGQRGGQGAARKEQLVEEGKMKQQTKVVDVGVVQKEGSACCTIF